MSTTITCACCEGPVPPKPPGRRGYQAKYCSSSCRNRLNSRRLHQRRVADGRYEQFNVARRKTPMKPCLDCGKEVRYGAERCQKHGQLHRKKLARRRARVERKLATAAEGTGPRWVLVTGICRACGKGYSSWNPSGGHCSALCRGSRKSDAAKQARRARERGWKLTKARRMALYERDGWICLLCGLPVDREATGTMEPDAPSLDHVVALADGGLHAPHNLQTAHIACNGAKEAREGRLRKVLVAA